MKKSRLLTATLLALATSFCVSSIARADVTLHGEVGPNPKTVTVGGKSVYLCETNVTDVTPNSDDSFDAFCGDFNTNWSSAFQSSTGQVFMDPTSLAKCTVYSDTQKAQIQNLFSHTYDYAYESDGVTVKNMSVLAAMQLSVWEILKETPTNALDITTGVFKITSPATADYITLANSFLANIADNKVWTIGTDTFNAYDVKVTVYATNPATISQTMLRVESTGHIVETPTPEPATLAVLGLGLLGTGIAARRRAK